MKQVANSSTPTLPSPFVKGEGLGEGDMFLLQGDHKCHGELFATLYSLLAVRSSWLFATCYQLLALGSVSKNARWPAPCAASGGPKTGAREGGEGHGGGGEHGSQPH